MKLLLLSLCGEDGADENTQNINLYLASLAKHVVPFFETKVILFSTFNAIEKTQARIRAFGLHNQIEVYDYARLPLSDDVRQWFQRTYYFSKIGVHMNMLFDYAKTQNFFEADWIFHTDTDLEFIGNFEANLQSINHLRAVNPKLLVSCAGDSNPISIRYKNKRYEFQPPPRWNVFQDPIPSSFKLHHLHPIEHQHNSPDNTADKLIFQHKCLKVRNDFVGLSRETATEYNLNWVHTGYSPEFEKDNEKNSEVSVATQEIKDLWNRHIAHTTLPLYVNINEDKGSLVLDWLKFGRHGVTWIQLRAWADMVHHFGSGWASCKESYVEQSRAILEKNYTDTESIWRGDYT